MHACLASGGIEVYLYGRIVASLNCAPLNLPCFSGADASLPVPTGESISVATMNGSSGRRCSDKSVSKSRSLPANGNQFQAFGFYVYFFGANHLLCVSSYIGWRR